MEAFVQKIFQRKIFLIALVLNKCFYLFVLFSGLDETIRLQKLQELIDHMPQSHKRTLEFLLKHLRKIEETDENKMCKEAIAIVWAPTICSSAYNNTKNDLEKCAKLIEVLMDIYPPTNLLSTKSKSVYDNVRGEASLLDIDRSSMMLERKTKLWPQVAHFSVFEFGWYLKVKLTVQALLKRVKLTGRWEIFCITYQS